MVRVIKFYTTTIRMYVVMLLCVECTVLAWEVQVGVTKHVKLAQAKSVFITHREGKSIYFGLAIYFNTIIIDKLERRQPYT